MSKVWFYNEDCFETMRKMKEKEFKVDLVLTSPPYNTCRKGRSDKYSTRYDVFDDMKTPQEYVDWTIDLFNSFDNVLVKNGVILYNFSYSSGTTKEDIDNIGLFYEVLYKIIFLTPFTIADRIIWKKKSALPNNVSPNKLTRIVEDVFVFCRKDEIKTFNANKQVKSQSSVGQNYYENVFNFVEAKNNDGSCPLNKATYSSELCEKLLLIYAKPSSMVYDSFMGTGTTAVACKRLGHNCIGSELSEAQIEFAKERLSKIDEE